MRLYAFDVMNNFYKSYKSISLGGVTNQNKLIERLHEKNIFVLAFDNDDSGKAATKSLLEKIQSKGQISVIFELIGFTPSVENILANGIQYAP